ncbi:serine hydrolase domain-containing protein [Sphingomonas mali]|uniref:serine hydrolase domain-containing protein n=1 Tax=Sphingomonas mali TaxID=40682 RepID=UPI0008305FFC|nr:serine hydrolase domain-containing protein [Sphingomonas mali]
MASESAGLTSEPTASPERDWSAVDALVGDAVDRKLLSGAVTMVWQGEAVAHSSAIGCQDITVGTPMTEDCIFRLFSMTKPVTAAAMMILWDEGKWSPADPIAKHLPELSDLKVMALRDSREVGPLSNPEAPPTIEHLMTHQVGFSYGFTDEPIDHSYRAARIPIVPHDITAEEYLARLATVPLAFEPGSGWRYSVAMDVQGIIIERLSGMPLRDFMKRRIFDPLGMNDTDFLVPDSKRERFATLYTLADDLLVEMTVQGELSFDNENTIAPAASELVLPYNEAPLLASGGAGLVSTAADYLRFGRMLLSRGELEGMRILSDAAVDFMTRSHTPVQLLTGTFGTPPHMLRRGYEYAYNGVAVTDPAAAGVRLGRGTYLWDGAAGCWFWVDPANDLVFVCMVQLLTDADRLSLQFRSRDIVAAILAGRQK